MSFSILAFIKAIILPPALNFVVILVGILLLNKCKYCARILLFVGALSLVLFCWFPFSHALLKSLEISPALEPPIVLDNEQAIVVLAAGSRLNDKEYAKAVDGSATLQRIHYGVFLHKQTKLPILVTGGNTGKENISEAGVMVDTLMNSYYINVKWQEDKARNTAENAIFSGAILKENGIDSVYLVTHAWHMSRAVMMFEQQGIKVTPAPTLFTPRIFSSALSYYIPSAFALYETRIALHEYIGILWYKFRY
jgi:uncharacterized SAM-binding protein YcdF (DUF218 family)